MRTARLILALPRRAARPHSNFTLHNVPSPIVFTEYYQTNPPPGNASSTPHFANFTVDGLTATGSITTGFYLNGGAARARGAARTASALPCAGRPGTAAGSATPRTTHESSTRLRPGLTAIPPTHPPNHPPVNPPRPAGLAESIIDGVTLRNINIVGARTAVGNCSYTVGRCEGTVLPLCPPCLTPA